VRSGRPTGSGASIVAALVVTLAGCGGSDVAPTEATAAPPDRIARCVDGDVTWRVRVTDVDDAAIGAVRIGELDAATVGASTVDAATVGASTDRVWTIVTTNPDTRERIEEPITAGDASGRALAVDGVPRLVSPDGRCTVYLAPLRRSPSAPPAATPVAIVGDSLAAGLVASSEARDALDADAEARGLAVLVDGQSGVPLADIDGTGGVMLDELRGAASIDGVHAVAIVLGANDAILAAFPDGEAKVAQRQRTDDAIRAAMDALEDVACVVVTTPPDRPIRNFDLGESYAVEARRVGEMLRSLVAHDDRLVLADFAGLSRSHHLTDGEPGDWFSGDDELHPNAEGVRALRAMILDALLRCPGSEPVNPR
jgi:lysophospholipase L1-like esterase